MPIEHQIVICGGVRGYLDAIEIKDIVAFVKPHLSHTSLPITPAIINDIESKGAISDESQAKLKQITQDFVASFYDSALSITI